MKLMRPQNLVLEKMWIAKQNAKLLEMEGRA